MCFYISHFIFVLPGIMKIMNDDNNVTTNLQQNTNDNNGQGIFGTPLTFPQEKQVNQEGISQVSTIAPENPLSITNDASSEQEVIPPEDDLVSMGVTFVGDDSELPAKNIFSADSSFREKEENAVQEIVKNQFSPQKEENPVETKDLEEDFSKTFSTPIETPTLAEEDHLRMEEEKLRRLYKELKDKAGKKKVVVKERLEKLRIEKESLGKELESIKDIEAIAQKIEEKLKSLEVIDNEIDSLEDQARQELQ